MRYIKYFLLALVISFSVAPAQAKDKAGGHGFYKAAKSYDLKAAKFKAAGEDKKAADFARLADIKRNAAKLADQGKWDEISWDEYHKILARYNGKSGGDKKHHKKKHHKKHEHHDEKHH